MICSAPGCRFDAKVRGMCRRHYHRWWKQNRQTECKVKGCEEDASRWGWCATHYESRPPRRKQPKQSREAQLKREFRISLEDYEAMRDGGCQICGRDLRSGSVHALDHDHETGKVRGMLCKRCNTGLSYFGDDASRLRAAARYLDR